MFLRELNQSIQTLPGIGPAAAKDFASLDILNVGDLLRHYPRAYEDRITKKPLYSEDLSYETQRIVNTIVTVDSHEYIGWGKKKTLKIRISDNSGTAHLICFGRNFLSRTLGIGGTFYLYGKFSYRYGELQSTAFETEPFHENPKNFNMILPIYSLSGNLSQNIFRKAVSKGLKEYGKFIEDELPEIISRQYTFPEKKIALKEIHFPKSSEQLQKAENYLKYEELFYLQLTIQRRNIRRNSLTREKRKLPLTLFNKLISRLPFELTPDQKTVLEEIYNDQSGTKPMMRLLQGDVGSGKTLVAFLASLPCIETGQQAALMAPTELLAKQHADNASKLLSPLGINVAFMSGSINKQSRKNLLRALAAGEVHILIGTHALFSSDVTFRSLGFVIIDEQQRFGVMQRLSVMEKGNSPDLLMMTATPIPRTMALTVFGDIDISTIRTMPPGRKTIITHLAKEGNEKKVYDRIREELDREQQAYFVYPLIQQSEKLNLKDARSMFDFLSSKIFSDFTLGLIHSKIPEEEKEKTMEDFVKGDIDLLVATSIVEVGVDVPNATCIVIEHAERFGLSALHQLRGRVGRGEHQSYAFLIFSKNLTDDGKQRLRIMKESSDGFHIAEEDLRLRGPGDVAGFRQSGYFRLDIADIADDFNLLKKAKTDAQKIIETDPGLLSPENSVIREVLQKAPPFEASIFQGG